MSARRILIVQGHPDASAPHLCHTLAQAYADAARSAGHALRTVHVAALDFPLLRSQREWEQGALPVTLQAAQDDIAWAEHLVFFFPLWLGDMPALLKAFLEQVARPGFAFKAADGQSDSPFKRKGLKGRSARLVVTMGMPAFVYRWFFRAHSVRSLERNVLGFVGIAPVRATLVGGVEQLGEAGIRQWQRKLQGLGAQAR